MRLEYKAAISLNQTVNSKILLICMDPPVLILGIVTLFLAFTLESQQIFDPQPRSPYPPLPSPPLPPSLVSPPLLPPPPPRKTPASAVEGSHQLNKHLSSSPVKERTNLGKKIGLMFVLDAGAGGGAQLSGGEGAGVAKGDEVVHGGGGVFAGDGFEDEALEEEAFDEILDRSGSSGYKLRWNLKLGNFPD